MDIHLYKFGNSTAGSVNKKQWIDIGKKAKLQYIEDISICNLSSNTITFSIAFAKHREYSNYFTTDLANAKETIMLYNKTRVMPNSKPYVIEDSLLRNILNVNNFFLTELQTTRPRTTQIMKSRPNINDYSLFIRINEQGGVNTDGSLEATADVVVRTVEVTL
jgi:hypothetical protein